MPSTMTVHVEIDPERQERQCYFGYSLKLEGVQQCITIYHMFTGLHTAMVKSMGDRLINQRVHKNQIPPASVIFQIVQEEQQLFSF